MSDGARCSQDADCTSGKCGTSNCICVSTDAGIANALCTSNTACLSGYCPTVSKFRQEGSLSATGVKSYCDDATTSCSTASDCTTGSCSNGICTVSEGEDCVVDANCTSGYCKPCAPTVSDGPQTECSTARGITGQCGTYSSTSTETGM